MKILTKLQAEQRLISYLPNDIKILAKLFKEANFTIYLVGGCIRDTFLGKFPKDYDLCTNALPEDIINILKNSNIQYNLQGEHFAVVVAKMEDDYEIASFRSDTKVEGSNRHPEVKLGVTMADDCKRRDFTINALFMDLSNCDIIDLVGGINDLENKIVRCVGNPMDRFEEDHLRKLRAIVRCVSDDFGIHMDTFNSIIINPELNISNERIMWELKKAYDKALDKKYLIDILYKSHLIYHIFKGIVISHPSNIDTSKIVSFNTFIASLVNMSNTNISKKLVDINYPVKISNSVEFLHNIHNFLNPMVFYNKRKSTDLTNDEILIFCKNDKISQFMVNFMPTEGLAEDFMKKGLVGKELGMALEQHYIEHFKASIK